MNASSLKILGLRRQRRVIRRATKQERRNMKRESDELCIIDCKNSSQVEPEWRHSGHASAYKGLG